MTRIGAAPDRPRRVAIVCSGMDSVKRGYEAYARDLFELLKDDPRLDLVLLKGNGRRRPDERVIFNLNRDARMNRYLCRFIGNRRRYYIEYVTFAVGLAPVLLTRKFDSLYVLEAPLYKFLSRWRHIWGAKFTLVHFTGGQLRPIPATPRDYLHHVTPSYRAAAEEYGFRPDNQFLIPHFIDTAPASRSRVPADLNRLRSDLRVPSAMPVVLSVGTLDMQVKRMDYVVRECAALEQPVFLLLLGHPDRETEALDALASEKLGPDRYAIRTVPRAEIYTYYALADVFVLASLREGFGLVFIEALACGTPVIAHDYDVTRYVLGDQAHFADLSRSGALTIALRTVLACPPSESSRRTRAEYVRRKYDVAALKDGYRRMFLEAAGARDA